MKIDWPFKYEFNETHEAIWFILHKCENCAIHQFCNAADAAKCDKIVNILIDKFKLNGDVPK